MQQELEQMNNVEDYDSNFLQLVTFKLGEEEFGIDILAVQEIIRMIQITMVPTAPFFIEGVINLRGNVIPVMNFRKRFKMPAIEYSNDSRIIVTEKDQKIVGFLVDAVSEVLRISENVVEPAPAVVSGIGSEYIKGVGKLDDRLLILLDLDMLLQDSNKKEQE